MLTFQILDKMQFYRFKCINVNANTIPTLPQHYPNYPYDSFNKSNFEPVYTYSFM